MKAVILVGGQGTRLRPLSCGIPKPMVPVLNRPLLDHILLNASKHGVTDFVLAVNHLPEVIKESFGDGSRSGVRINYVVEGTPLGTSGAVKNAEPFLDERFFVFNGDMLTGIDLGEMMRRHQEVKPKVTIALTPVDNPIIYGVVEQDEHGMVKRFVEKPDESVIPIKPVSLSVEEKEGVIFSLAEVNVEPPIRNYSPVLYHGAEQLGARFIVQQPVVLGVYCPECGYKASGLQGLKIHVGHKHSDKKEKIMRVVALF